jgi:hypothetical protein
MAHEEYGSRIDACYACAATCDHCAAACLNESDPKPMAECIRLDVDCAEICRLAAGYMARGSSQSALICRTCAEICDACGAECERHDHDHCKECAEACRRCAEECRRMAA